MKEITPGFYLHHSEGGGSISVLHNQHHAALEVQLAATKALAQVKPIDIDDRALRKTISAVEHTVSTLAITARLLDPDPVTGDESGNSHIKEALAQLNPLVPKEYQLIASR